MLTFKEWLIQSITEERREGDDYTPEEIQEEIDNALRWSDGEEETDVECLVELICDISYTVADSRNPGLFLYKSYEEYKLKTKE